jgi:hypothetical protein
MSELLGELRDPGTLLAVPQLYRAVRANVVVDAELTVAESLRIARVLSSVGVEMDADTLPIVGGREGRKWVARPSVEPKAWVAQRLTSRPAPAP